MRKLLRINKFEKSSKNISWIAMAALFTQWTASLIYLKLTDNFDNALLMGICVLFSLGTSMTIFNKEPGLVRSWWRFQWRNPKLAPNFVYVEADRLYPHQIPHIHKTLRSTTLSKKQPKYR
jgi:hypothetical protein